jgi:branched-chain amino acid transport system permease protein
MNMKFNVSQLKGKLAPLVGVVIVLAVLPVVGAPRTWILYLFVFFIYLIMANMFNLLAGYSGLLSLCQPAFIGLAGYTLVIFTWSGLPFYLGIIAGAIVAAIFALLISFPVFRMGGIYFAVGTLVVPEALKVVFLLWRPVGGELHGGGAGYMVKGVSGITTADTYLMALFVALASGLVLHYILNSKFGLGLSAIRDNDNTAASSGINVFQLKLISFIISAFVTGLAGGIFYIYQGYIEPTSAFNINWTMAILLATVIGGMGIEEGPIAGAAIYVWLHFTLAKYAGISLLIQGIILVIIMLSVPEGIMGFIRRKRTYSSILQLITGRR